MAATAEGKRESAANALQSSGSPMPKRIKTASLNADLPGSSSKHARTVSQACLHDGSVRDARAKPRVLASTLQPASRVPESAPPTAPAPRDSLASSLTRAPNVSSTRFAELSFPRGARADALLQQRTALRQHAALRQLVGLPAPGHFVPVEEPGQGPTCPFPNQAAGRGSGAGSAAVGPSSSGSAGFWGTPEPCARRAAPGAAFEPATRGSADRAVARASAAGGWVSGRAHAAGSAPCRAAGKRPGEGQGAVGGGAASEKARCGGRVPAAWAAPQRPPGPQGIVTAKMALNKRASQAEACVCCEP